MAQQEHGPQQGQSFPQKDDSDFWGISSRRREEDNCRKDRRGSRGRRASSEDLLDLLGLSSSTTAGSARTSSTTSSGSSRPNDVGSTAAGRSGNDMAAVPPLFEQKKATPALQKDSVASPRARVVDLDFLAPKSVLDENFFSSSSRTDFGEKSSRIGAGAPPAAFSAAFSPAAAAPPAAAGEKAAEHKKVDPLHDDSSSPPEIGGSEDLLLGRSSPAAAPSDEERRSSCRLEQTTRSSRAFAKFASFLPPPGANLVPRGEPPAGQAAARAEQDSRPAETTTSSFDSYTTKGVFDGAAPPLEPDHSKNFGRDQTEDHSLQHTDRAEDHSFDFVTAHDHAEVSCAVYAPPDGPTPCSARVGPAGDSNGVPNGGVTPPTSVEQDPVAALALRLRRQSKQLQQLKAAYAELLQKTKHLELQRDALFREAERSFLGGNGKELPSSFKDCSTLGVPTNNVG